MAQEREVQNWCKKVPIFPSIKTVHHHQLILCCCPPTPLRKLYIVTGWGLKLFFRVRQIGHILFGASPTNACLQQILRWHFNENNRDTIHSTQLLNGFIWECYRVSVSWPSKSFNVKSRSSVKEYLCWIFFFIQIQENEIFWPFAFFKGHF